MQYPEFTSVTVVQAWPEPGSLKSCGEHHLEPQGSRAYSSAVPRVISLPTFSNLQALPRRTPSPPSALTLPWHRYPEVMLFPADSHDIAGDKVPPGMSIRPAHGR